MRARVPQLILAVTLVCVVLDTMITAEYASLLADATWARHGWPLATAATLGCALMGALILGRHPRHPIGWLLCVASLASVSLVTETYSRWVLDHDGPGSETAGRVAAWVSNLVGGPMAITAVALILLLSPDGHLPSRRWRWVARGTVAGLAIYSTAVLTIPPADFEPNSTDATLSVPTLVLFNVGILLIVVGLVTSAVGVVRRLRRASGQARRQLLWVASAGAFLAFGFVFLLVAQAVQDKQTLLGATPLFSAYLTFPVCTAVAVLRHQLFDIDVIVNRAMVLGLATALVAVGYVGLVVGLGGALGSGTGGFWPSLLATAAVAMAFQPLRRRVVRLADRIAYGPAATPYEALADFSRRLGDSPDPSDLLPAVAEAAGEAVSARSATARLHVPGSPDQVAGWPAGAEPAGVSLSVPVMDVGGALGRLTVSLPAGRSPRPGERRLLEDLAGQAAVAFHNARLAAELAHQVAQLDEQTLALARSRQRLITAGDAERDRLERSIAREVVPHIAVLPARLDSLAGMSRPALDGSELTPLVTRANTALEALREITRGVYPAQLTRAGLEPALRSLTGRLGAHLQVEVPLPALDARVAAAAYFCAAEALGALAGPLVVELRASDEQLHLVVTGCQQVQVPMDRMRDRVETAGGHLSHEESDGAAVLDVRLPLGLDEGVAV